VQSWQEKKSKRESKLVNWRKETTEEHDEHMESEELSESSEENEVEQKKEMAELELRLFKRSLANMQSQIKDMKDSTKSIQVKKFLPMVLEMEKSGQNKVG